ncbi:MAG: T9SS type A sorting domain-containing protein [Candidatus Syntrophosphaera sp.]|nr:T9SS type A sorting domain-containing protein [Candidatus Syntrophosphaera sp.]
MKRIMLLLLVSMSVCIVLAASGDYVPAQQSRAFAITAKSAGHMDITFTLPSFEIEELAVGEDVFHRIFIPHAGSTLESGLPELPTLSMNLAIPRQGSVQIEALGSSQDVLAQFKAYPVQQGSALESPKSFVIDADFYGSGTSYPSSAIQYSDPMILRDFRIINVQVNPFFWDPLTQELTINQSMDFRVNFTPEPGMNELEGELLSVSPAFAKIYEAMILNFDDYRYIMYSNVPPRYLIIYGTNSDPNFTTALNEYVLWKKQKGADVDLASTAANEAGSSTTTIKNYIQNAYNNPATRPDFVILLGDTSGSYSIPAYTVSSGAGDYPYTHLAGSDILGDCFIGRISAENLSQLQLLFAKIYLYEKDINLATADWLDRMLLVGDNSPSGISTMYISKYIKERALFVNPNYTFTEIYNASPAATQINAAINQGVGFYSYRGYIDYSPPAESALFNGYRLLHAVNITCGTNNYSSGTSEMEQFIRYGTPAAPKGAVTGIGMSTSSTHTGFNNVLHGGIFGGIYQYDMRTMGEALLNGRLYMSQTYGVAAPSSVTSFTHWCNLMGDPTMEVFTGTPNHFNITALGTIPLGLSLLDVNVRDSLNLVVEGASVTLTQSGSIISRGYTDAEGNIILVLPQSMTINACVLTVSKHNFKPLQQTINLDNSGTLVPGIIVIDDDNTGASSGNDDGMVNADETIEFLFGLINTGADPIAGISGYVTTTSPYVTFVDSLVTYATIAGTELGFNTAPVVMQIAPDAPHEVMMRLHLMLTDSQNESYDVSEFVPIHNAKIMYNNSMVTNGGNQVLDPGETAGFTITVSNIAPTGVSDIWGRLYSLNDLVSVTDHTAYFGDLLHNVQVTPSTDMFEIYGRPMLLPGMVIPMQLKLYNDAGFVQWLDFSITVGVVTVGDPLGPDAYGYVIYDDQDTSYEDCPVYDWVGIAPAEGGLGTALAISDSYNSGDEGDQVGAQSLAVVDLPFPFQFYGVIYNQITVCSNGFLAMGVSENAEFRNYRIPGPMGPNPMIAAFWDDLATHAGSGIYTWFDRNNHAFVIEWYNMKSGYNGSSPETFQIILYDQSVHSTSLGDGPIKIQWHTFNNVNASTSNYNHGCYATIGIEDHTGMVGLEYSYGNLYPTAASPLGHQRAIYITNVPIYHYEAHVILGETYIEDENGNGVCEPGETIELGVQLLNIGNLTAENVSATLSTDNPHITMLNNSSEYFPLEGDQFGVNRTPFVFSVAPNCPNGTVVDFNLEITNNDVVWNRSFSLRVDASVLTYHSFMINDADTNFNGIIDPLETVKLVINLNNHADVQARDVFATLSTSSSDVIISDPIIMHTEIAANVIMQFEFELQFVGTAALGDYVPFQFNVSISNGLPMNTNLMIPYNMATIFNDFETNNGNFISEIGWVWGTPTQVTPFSGTKLWATTLSGNYPDFANYTLVTPIFALEAGAVLSFKHRYGFEAGYDGGNISISTNNGDTWTTLTPVGGYPYSSLTGLSGQPGYSGSISNWETVSVNLNNYAGQLIMLRFRMGSDGATNNIGWFIDNFELSNVNQKTGYIHGTVIPASSAPVTDVLVTSDNHFATHPKADGSYRLYLPNGTYSATALLYYHQPASINNIQISPNDPVHLADFTLIYLPEPTEASFDVDNDTGLVTLNWTEPYDPVLPVMTYHVYRKFDSGPFDLVQQTTSTSYSEAIALEGSYKYYVCAVYLNNEGAPSDTLAFLFPFIPSNSEEPTPGLVTRLNNNYPNPFNPSTSISFDLARAGNVKLSVYNVKGQLVRVLANGPLNAGSHRLVWDGRDGKERSVSSGVYFYRLETKDYSSTRKMLMLK